MHNASIRRPCHRAARALAVLPLALLAACGKPAATANTTTGQPAAAAQAIAAAAPVARDDASTTTDATLAGRNGELTNPDNATMVYLYYDLAGIAPPIDQWVENDDRVRFAPGADKAAQRAAVKSAIQAGLAAVRGVGVLHLTTRTSLSAYDPTYGEFTIGALAPGMTFTFQAQRQTVSLKFNNSLAAQTWSVPADKAQAITDRVGGHGLTLDTTLKIDKVLPTPDGGTIVARVLSWNLRDDANGATIARMQVPAR